MSVVTCNPRSFLGLNDEKTEPLGWWHSGSCSLKLRKGGMIQEKHCCSQR